MRSGFAPIPLKLPKIMGEDVAGMVVAAPEGSKVRTAETAQEVGLGRQQQQQHHHQQQQGDKAGVHLVLSVSNHCTVTLGPHKSLSRSSSRVTGCSPALAKA